MSEILKRISLEFRALLNCNGLAVAIVAVILFLLIMFLAVKLA